MADKSPIDEIHALVSGSLASEDEARLRERCAADPELQALLEEYLEVYALTECVDAEPPESRLTFEEVEGALVPQRVWGMVPRWTLRVAAAVLVLVVGSFAASRVFSDRSDRSAGGEAGRPLALAEIPLRVEAVPDNGPEIPASLADYRPVNEKGVQWITSLDEAEAMARASSRPVLLFLHVEKCPWCIEMREGPFADPEVLAEVVGFVPALVDIMEPNTDPGIRKLAKEGWPWFGVVDADGAAILSFPGRQGAGDFADHLRKACEVVGPPVISWARANELARLWFEARQFEREGRYGDAYVNYSALAEVERAPLIGAASKTAIERIAQRALGVVLSAREVANGEAGVEPAIRMLDGEISSFAATPYATDLEKIRTYLANERRFPEIAHLDTAP